MFGLLICKVKKRGFFERRTELYIYLRKQQGNFVVTTETMQGALEFIFADDTNFFSQNLTSRTHCFFCLTDKLPKKFRQ